MPCSTCIYYPGWPDPGKCIADLEFHEPDDHCAWFTKTLRKEPLPDPPEPSPEALLARRCLEMDKEFADD